MNDDREKEMLDENTNNLQGQKSLNYEFSTLDKNSNRIRRRKAKSMKFKTKKYELFNFRSYSILTPSKISFSYFPF